MSKHKVSIRLNWYDRLIGFFSPEALVKRKRAKIYNELVSRKYEGADKGRRTSGWFTGSGSANAELAGSKALVRERARDLVRNNPYAFRGVQVITNNVVGRGIKTQIKLDTRAKVSTKEKRINNVWRAWAETTECDHEGVHNLAGLQRLIMRSVVESGEVLVRYRRSPRTFTTGPDGRVVEVPPIKLQVLEGDFISLSQLNQTLDNGNSIVNGVEIDTSGKKVAYHLYKTHPGNIALNIQNTFDTVRVPAEEILHIYKTDRPGQLSGISWLHPIILRLRDFDLYEDAQLKRQQCAAMFTAFIHDIEGVDDLDAEAEAEIGEKMEPGIMEILPPGKDIKLSNPPGADNYKEYTSVVLRSIASGLGITYESLTGDLSDVNFSAGRMGWLEMQRNIDTWQRVIMITQFLDPVFKAFKDGLELIGLGDDRLRAVHTPPKREMIDPSKEIEAMKVAVRNGFKTLSSVARELGEDPDTHFAEIASDFQVIDDLGLTLDSDSRKRDNAGKAIVESSDSEAPPAEDEE